MSNLNLAKTITDLQSSGISVHVHHHRPKHTKMIPVTDLNDGNGLPIKGLFRKEKMFKETGGKTYVTLTKLINDNSVSVTEEAICHRNDRFQKANGTRLAIVRAIHELDQVISLPE